MKTKLIIIISLILGTLLISSCTQPSPGPNEQPTEAEETPQAHSQDEDVPAQTTGDSAGMDSPKHLSEKEQEIVISLAVDAAEEWLLEGKGEYSTDLAWVAKTDNSTWRWFWYNRGEWSSWAKKLESAKWYPGVTIRFKKWGTETRFGDVGAWWYLVQVVVELETRQTVEVLHSGYDYSRVRRFQDEAYRFTSDYPSPPDGRIMFSSQRDGQAQIYVMNADGSGLTRLTTSETWDREPVWSPNGTKIAFVRDKDVYVMDADGNNAVRLTDNPANDYSPTWSPDGTQIAFVSDRGGTNAIYIMNADGSGQTKLTGGNNEEERDPAWSPDGERIAFVSEAPPYGGREIFVVDANGDNQIQITEGTTPSPGGSAGSKWEPAWSPDGTKIAFSSNQEDRNFDIYVMNSDGSDITRLTENPGEDSSPTWAPDGKYISFSSQRHYYTDIHVISVKGECCQVRLTANSANDEYPSWTMEN